MPITILVSNKEMQVESLKDVESMEGLGGRYSSQYIFAFAHACYDESTTIVNFFFGISNPLMCSRLERGLSIHMKSQRFNIMSEIDLGLFDGISSGKASTKIMNLFMM